MKRWVMGTALIALVGLVGCKEDLNVASNAVAEMDMEAAVAAEAAAVPESSAVIVTVNGESLTEAEMQKELSMIQNSPQFQSLPPEQVGMVMNQMQARIVDRFINHTLLTQAAAEAGIEVEDAEIDEYMAMLSEQLPEGMTIEQMVAAQGLEMDKLTADITADIKIRKLLDQQTANIPAPSAESVQEFYQNNPEMFTVPESVTASHILVSVEADADEEAKAAAKAELEEIREQIMAGDVEFEEAAATHSACPSKERGGDLGTFARGRMVPAFEEAAFSQAVGEVGEIVETPFGFHIIKVTDSNPMEVQPLDAVSEQIAEQMQMQQQQEEVQGYIATLRDDAEIVYAEAEASTPAAVMTPETEMVPAAGDESVADDVEEEEKADAQSEAVEVEWLTDYEAAKALAAESGKPILMDFTGSDWCGWCIRLKKEVFSQPAFLQYASENLVLLMLDFPSQKPQSDDLKAQNQALAEQFDIKGYPTIILADAEGNEIARTGYQRGGAEKYVEHLKELLNE